MEHNLTPQNVIKEKLSKQKAIILIVFYFLLFFVGATLISLLFKSIPNAVVVYSEKEQIIDQLQLSYSISYMDEVSFLELSDEDIKKIDYYLLDDGLYYILTSKKLLDEFDEDDLVYYFTEKDLMFDSELLPVKIDRVGYSNNDDFLTNYGISDPIFTLTAKTKQTFTPTASIFVNFIIYIIATIVIIVLTYNILIKDFKSLPKGLETLGLVLLGVVIMYGANFISGMFSLVVKVATKDNSITSINQFMITKQFSSKFSFVAIISIVILAPLVEELIFRKAFFTAIKNQWLALAISSLIFGLIHVTGESSLLLIFTNIIPYLISGVALGLIYIKNKHNIWLSILAHAIINGISVLLIILL